MTVTIRRRPTILLAVVGTLVAGLLAAVPTQGAQADDRDIGPISDSHGGDHVRARPDTTGGDENDFSAPPEALYTQDTEHFRIHWTDQTEDAATQTFVDDVAGVFEEVWRIEIDELGWPAPPADESQGGNDLVDVYLVDLGRNAYGYASPDDEALCGGCPDPYGFLVLDNDYLGFEPSPEGALRATAAHEFSHLIQFGMAFEGESWAYEATAVWLENQVYPDIDARTPYLIDFASSPQLALTDFGESGGFERSYGAYVWNLWLADRYGPGIVLESWVASTAASDHLLEGYDAALREQGTNLVSEYIDFAAATAGWEVGGFPSELQRYPRVARADLLSGSDVLQIQLDHTAMYLADIGVEPGQDSVTVTVRGDKFISGGVALVAASGSTVLSATDRTMFDGRAEVTLTGIAGVDRVTLVVVNADATLAVPKPARSDSPRYFFSDVRYLIGVDVDPGPVDKS